MFCTTDSFQSPLSKGTFAAFMLPLLFSLFYLNSLPSRFRCYCLSFSCWALSSRQMHVLLLTFILSCRTFPTSSIVRSSSSINQFSSLVQFSFPPATFNANLYACYLSEALLTFGEKSTSPILNFLHFFSACNSVSVICSSSMLSLIFQRLPSIE